MAASWLRASLACCCCSRRSSFRCCELAAPESANVDPMGPLRPLRPLRRLWSLCLRLTSLADLLRRLSLVVVVASACCCCRLLGSRASIASGRRDSYRLFEWLLSLSTSPLVHVSTSPPLHLSSSRLSTSKPQDPSPSLQTLKAQAQALDCSDSLLCSIDFARNVCLASLFSPIRRLRQTLPTRLPVMNETSNESSERIFPARFHSSICASRQNILFLASFYKLEILIFCDFQFRHISARLTYLARVSLSLALSLLFSSLSRQFECFLSALLIASHRKEPKRKKNFSLARLKRHKINSIKHSNIMFYTFHN